MQAWVLLQETSVWLANSNRDFVCKQSIHLEIGKH